MVELGGLDIVGPYSLLSCVVASPGSRSPGRVRAYFKVQSSGFELFVVTRAGALSLIGCNHSQNFRSLNPVMFLLLHCYCVLINAMYVFHPHPNPLRHHKKQTTHRTMNLIAGRQC